MSTYCFVYMTASDKEEARRIGRVLVEERLAACVNMLDHMESLYWWEGRIETGHEAVLIAKTREDRTEELIERVKELHSYDCPCIVTLPIQSGHADFLRWIEEQTVD